MNTQSVTTGPLRVLHCLGGTFDQGGVETWLLQVLQRIDRSRYQVDVMTATDRKGAYDDQAMALGARVIPCLWTRRDLLHFSRSFKRIMDEFGPYDIVHVAPGRLHGALILYLAYRAGVPMRVFHYASAGHVTKARISDQSVVGRLLKGGARAVIRRYATHILSWADESAAGFLGSNILQDKRYQWLPGAIDLQPFAEPVNCAVVRESLGIPQEAKVVGHVGSFRAVKNHDLFVETAAELAQQRPDIYFLLVGDGGERERIEEKVKRLGLMDRFIFAGVRSDVPAILRCGMDLLLFPSWHEGMGRVVVEAQASGLPCVISNTIPSEVDLVKPLIKRLSLEDSPAVWAQAVRKLLEQPPAVSPEDALAIVQQSELNIEKNVLALEELYATCLPTL